MFEKQKCGSLAACICPKLPLFPLLRDLCGISHHILLCVSRYGAKGAVLGIGPGLCLVLVTGHSDKKKKKKTSVLSDVSPEDPCPELLGTCGEAQSVL